MELSEKEIGLLKLFQEVTRMEAEEIDDTEYGMLFFVASNSVGKAVGKKGRNIEILEKKVKKRVFILPVPESVEQFIRDVYRDIDIVDIQYKRGEDKDEALLIVKNEQRKDAIGKGGERIKTTKHVTKKKFNMDVRVVTESELESEKAAEQA
ncbi:MAG: KH domain-containing protein [Candidatus Anstonellales archaeon]